MFTIGAIVSIGLLVVLALGPKSGPGPALAAGAAGLSIVVLILLLARSVIKDYDRRLELVRVEAECSVESRARDLADKLVEAEKVEILGEVSAGLAHEIRNPLSAILSGISLLESSRRTPDERERITNLIRKEGGRLNSALTDFLLFARPRPTKKVPLDPAGLVRDIVAMMEEDPEIKGGARIDLELGEVGPVRFDNDQLRQVIWNLLLNALQAAGDGRVTVRVDDFEDGRWRLEVEDNGPGVPDEIEDEIIRPFFSTKKESIGLGLSIVKGIVDAHGGTIAHQRPAAGGAAFIMTVPKTDDSVGGEE